MSVPRRGSKRHAVDESVLTATESTVTSTLLCEKSDAKNSTSTNNRGKTRKVDDVRPPLGKRVAVAAGAAGAADAEAAEVVRCDWTKGRKHLDDYHDNEWGRPCHDDRLHFEYLVLDGAQAGLNWEMILKKREGYRKAYKNFDVAAVANMSDEELGELMSNTDIVRNKQKINSARTNARIFLAIQKEFGSFDKYIWKFVNETPVVNNWNTSEEVPSRTPLSDSISNDLKARGMKFVGTTIVYAFLQTVGMVNDHLTKCFCRRIGK
jgi:DNA-3-methyladenine glycosylase I